MTQNKLQFEQIGLATEKPDILTGLLLNISGAITGDSIMKHAVRSRDKTGRYAQESYIKVVNCERCGKEFRRTKCHRRFCSLPCYWGNKKYIDPQGYICIKAPNHPHATTNGWIREHIVVATKKFKRNLIKGECVHHIDGNRQNNQPDNLTIMLIGLHVKEHYRRRKGG